MSRADQILAMTPEQRYKVQFLAMYRILRRTGRSIDQALEQTPQRVARLIGAVAVMNASSWAANPVRVAQQASIAA